MVWRYTELESVHYEISAKWRPILSQKYHDLNEMKDHFLRFYYSTEYVEYRPIKVTRQPMEYDDESL